MDKPEREFSTGLQRALGLQVPYLQTGTSMPVQTLMLHLERRVIIHSLSIDPCHSQGEVKIHVHLSTLWETENGSHANTCIWH